MIGSDSNNRGRSPEIDDEDILNVLRRSHNKEVPTRDILEDDSITIGYEGLRQRLNQLEDDNRLSSRSSGKMRMWQLGELESQEPVREPKMAQAHRWANLSRDTGKTFAYFGFGFLFASIVFFIMFLHAQAGQITPPFLSQREVLVTGYTFGYIGAGLGVIAGVSLGAGTIIPKATAFWLRRKTTGERGEV